MTNPIFTHLHQPGLNLTQIGTFPFENEPKHSPVSVSQSNMFLLFKYFFFKHDCILFFFFEFYIKHIEPSKQHVFLAGCQDRRIIQYDINSGKIVQIYDQHLGPVNTITFVDNNRRFVSTSDDKSIRIWEWDIPVVIKYISEPHMHSMPSVTLTPDQRYFLAQSMDNQILTYTAGDRYRMAKKKVFKGHVSSGYACQIAVSPDGQ